MSAALLVAHTFTKATRHVSVEDFYGDGEEVRGNAGE